MSPSTPNVPQRSLRPPSPQSEFWTGARDVLPLIVGAFPFGIIFGTLAISKGVSIAATIGLSSIVFAGSAQFIAVGMIAAGSGWLLIVFTAFIVNLRHLLYAIALLPHVQHLSQRWKLVLGFFLTDESFAIAIRRYEPPDYLASRPDVSPYKHWYYLGAALTMYISWQIWTWVGVTLGQVIPNATEWGLDFAMSATFIGMIIPYVKTKPMGMAVTVAGAVAVLAYPLPHKLGLVVAAIAGIMAGVYSERFFATSTRPSRGGHHD